MNENRDELRKKLKEKIKNKQVYRCSKDEKEKFVQNKLKEAGIKEDLDKIKESLKKLNPDQLKNIIQNSSL